MLSSTFLFVSDILYPILVIYLLGINLAGFAAMGMDKRKAKRQQWRIPEKTLFLLAILGGSVGSLLGMRVFHHKTKHRSFTIGMPAILIAQLLLAGWVMTKL